MRKNRSKKNRAKVARELETNRQKLHAGHFDCPVCGQEPAQNHPQCCSYCGLSCNLQFGCGSDDCHTPEIIIPETAIEFTPDKIGDHDTLHFDPVSGKWFLTELVCHSSDRVGGTCRCINHPAFFTSIISGGEAKMLVGDEPTVIDSIVFFWNLNNLVPATRYDVDIVRIDPFHNMYIWKGEIREGKFSPSVVLTAEAYSKVRIDSWGEIECFYKSGQGRSPESDIYWRLVKKNKSKFVRRRCAHGSLTHYNDYL